MAQDGDTITYTYSGGTSVFEDVSDVDTAVVDYCDGAGSENNNGLTSGGRVENAEIDVSGQNSLYLWVASNQGRYNGARRPRGAVAGGKGSTEISFSNTDANDSSDEPFLVASGGAGGSVDGARGGDAEGTPPPDGGDSSSFVNGDGAIDDQNRGLVSGGTTTAGGGSTGNTDGEIQVSYKQSLSPPDPPSNLSANVQ